MKHSKMNDAAALMEQAKSDIQRFQRELRDVQVSLDLAWKSAASFPLRISFWTGWWQIYGAEQDCRCKRTGDDAINRIERYLLM